MVSLAVNGKKYEVDVSPDVPLLWVIREQLGLTGTKYGCGIARCGACTVHVDGEAVRSCSLPVSSAEGKQVITIEGIGATPVGKAVQEAWIFEDVPQCGYCQPGMIMSAAALLAKSPRPTNKQIDAAVSNICRCGTYQRIRRSVHRAAHLLGKGGKG